MTRIINWLDNIGIRNKLLIIYFVCIIFPIILTNIIAYKELEGRIRQESKANLVNILNNVSRDVSDTLTEIEGFTNSLYTKMELYEALEYDYEKSLDFVNTYIWAIKRILSEAMPYYYQIQSINIYTDNNTLFDSGSLKVFNKEAMGDLEITYNYQRGDIKLKNSAWISLHTEYLLNQDEHRKYLTVYRNLDRYRNYSQYHKILAIDINLSVLEEILSKQNVQGDIYIINRKNQIIARTNSEANEVSHGYFSILNKEVNSKGKLVLEQETNIQDLRIVGIFDEDKIYSAIRPVEQKLYFMTILSILVTSVCIGLIANSFCRRTQALVKQIDKLEGGKFGVIGSYGESKDEIGILIRSMNRMSLHIKDLIEKKYILELTNTKIELESRQAEINALQSQVNPHFMFNALEAIRLRSVIKGERETAEIIKYMSRMFRRLINWNTEWITIKEELDFIIEFLKIQQYRFDDELEFSIHMEEDAAQYKIPKMILQPLVENACVHGVERVIGIRRIEVQVEVKDNFIYFSIWDNGIGISKEKIDAILKSITQDNIQGVSVGMKNVFRRISLYYGEQSHFSINSKENEYTIIQLVLPINHDNNSIGGKVDDRSIDC